MKEGYIRRLLTPAVSVLCMSLAFTGCDPLHPGTTEETNATVYAPVTSGSLAPEVEETSETTVDHAAVRRQSAEDLICKLYSDITGSELPDGYYADQIEGITDDTVCVNDAVTTIISSVTFADTDLSDEEFAFNCHMAFTGETPDELQLRYYTDLLGEGVSREVIADMMMRNFYFAELCSGYGFLPEFTPANSAYTEDRYDFIANTEFPEHLLAFGGYAPDEEILEMLYSAMDDLTEDNRDFGFMLIDVNSGKGLSYNVDEIFYTASSIKGPFAASFACQDPDTAAGWEATIINMLVNSDNDAYTTLNNTYRRVYIQEWCEEIGIDPDPFRYKYPHIPTRYLTALWMRSYEFFESGEFGAQAGSWFEDPAYSLIHSELGDRYVTRSKAGWLVDDDPTHTTTVDGGIVYADNGPYVIVIMSKVPRDIEPLRPLMQALEAAHLTM